MRTTPNEDDINERKEIWQGIRWWMQKLGLTPSELAFRASFSVDFIKRGIGGEPVPIRHALRNFVEAFGLKSARQKGYEDTADVLTDDEYKQLLKPLRQDDLWNIRSD